MKQQLNFPLLVDSVRLTSKNSRQPPDSSRPSGEVLLSKSSPSLGWSTIRIEPPLRVLLEQDSFTLKLLEEKMNALYSVLKIFVQAEQVNHLSMKKNPRSIEIIIHHKIGDTEYQDFLKNLSLLLDHNFTISVARQTHKIGVSK